VTATDKFLPTPSHEESKMEESEVQTLKVACVNPNEPDPKPPNVEYDEPKTVIRVLPAAGPLPRLIALTSGALKDTDAVKDPSKPDCSIETCRAAPSPRLAFDRQDDPLIQREDSILELLIVSKELRSSLEKPPPKTTIMTAPVVGIL
jgi:hypothetical protein